MEQATSFPCKQGAVRAVRFNVDGNYCITCGSDKSLKLWNPHKSLHIKTYMGHGYEVLDACGSCDNASIASGGSDKQVFQWDVTTGKTLRRFKGHAGFVNAVMFNEDSSVIFSASLDNSVKAWDCRSRSKDPIQVLDEATDSVTCLCVSDHEILTGSADQRMRRYDLRQGKLCEDFVGKAVTSVTFTRDGQCALISTLDSTIRLLDKDNGELLNEFKGHRNEDYKIDSCLNNSDTVVYSGSEDGYIYCWDLVEGKICGKLQHSPRGVVHSISSHPTEPMVLSASLDVVFVWKPKDIGQT